MDAIHSAAPLIELRSVRRRYGGGEQPEVEVLRGVSLRIHAGEFVAIVGASGSGKSTLMNLLGCLDRPSSGQYLFQGQDVAGLGPDALAWLRREAFGFVFQGYHLIRSESARENVEVPAVYAGLPRSERAERASALLSRLGLAGKQHLRPTQLSGGQQQRVSIARALMNGGRIILADEPTGALDTHSGAEVMALLHELADAGHTIVLITHDREVAAQARRVIEIRDGQIVADSGAAGPVLGFEAKLASSAQGISASSYKNNSESARAGALWAELAEAARGAWRGMRIHRTRTALTLLGIVLGVASVIVMMAVGEGAKQRVVEQMGAMGTTIMYLGTTHPREGGPQGEITAQDLEALAQLPDIGTVMPVIGDPTPVRYANVERQLYVFAASEDMPRVHHWQVAQGRYYTAAEDRDMAPLVVLGHKAGEQFFPDTPSPLGRHLLIGNAPFEVIGVMAERGADSGAQNYDDMVFIPYQAGRARVYRAQTQPDYTVVAAASVAQVQAAEQAMRALLLQRHGREDFAIGNPAAKLQAEAQTRNAMTLMLGLIAAVSLVVGGIGVMNVMLMTVRERTREIGIRMATGARQGDILRQFLTEAVLVTLVGGGSGVAMGLLVGAALMVAGVPAIFSVTAMAGAFACAVATGLVFGYMPARRAAALDPVVALASE
ncbi:MacB family efflux pump subunit [Acidovorax sp. 56]|uniref:MacB family efflux pump subunit n=1 Tax=Acidovorax sp. 56 TaxID=2035205 RepID=UPI000C17050A|nr:MacB family efflux pump subunit [Acidovorax sp. 56]